VALAFLVLTGGTSWWCARQNKAAFNSVAYTWQILAQVEMILVDTLDMETRHLRFAVTGDETFSQSYQAGIAEVQKTLAAAKQLTQNPDQRRRLAALEPLIQKEISTANEVVRMRRNGDIAGAVQLSDSEQSRQTRKAISELIAEIEQAEKQLLTLRTDRAMALSRMTIAIVAFASLLSLGLIALASVMLRRDVQKRLQAEEQIVQLNGDLKQHADQLEAANKELTSFSYSVSHDLRSPLRGIDGFSLALEEDYADKFDDLGRSHLARVRAAARRMGELIDDLLKLSQITRAELHLQPVDLSALARIVADELQRREPQRQVEWAIADGLTAEGDPQLLRVALENLFGNAWKFTGKRPSARIEFGTIAAGATRLNDSKAEMDQSLLTPAATVFFIRDNGAGFDMAHASKLFGAFQRLHSRAEFEGTGIGLATVQRIIHRHGGRVWAEGEVDKGAAFFFSL